MPPDDAERITREVFSNLLESTSKLGSLPEILKSLRKSARRQALAATAHHRDSSNDPAAWTEALENHLLPPATLNQLRADNPNTEPWRDTLNTFRQRSWNVIKSQGVPPEEIDDVLSDTLLALLKPRGDGITRPLDSVQVYEELMPLMHAMARNIATDHMRAKSAQKRLPSRGGFVGGEAAENVASEEAVPGDAVSLYECYKECRDCLTDFQWDILVRLYVLESANRMSLIEEPAVLRELGVKASASSATRRRRLNEYLDSMIAALAERVRLP